MRTFSIIFMVLELKVTVKLPRSGLDHDALQHDDRKMENAPPKSPTVMLGFRASGTGTFPASAPCGIAY